MKLIDSALFFSAYVRARRLDRIRDRRDLEAVQRRWLERLMKEVSTHSLFYRKLAGLDWSDWPKIDKAIWMGNFDAINTVGARLADVSRIALQAETTRDFSLKWGEYTVGLSTGTSGSRGIFLVSPGESARWGGTLLAKLQRHGAFAAERIALVLRAGAPLYEGVGALRMRFRFFDQSVPWSDLLDALCRFDPTILVAPANVLRLLADATTALKPTRVVAVAEVLDRLDRGRIECRFDVAVEQIYQATEGLLGTSCEYGTVHLNEPYVLVEPEWQDADRTRFIPVVTDLWRRSQPVVRYRLNDVLQVAHEPCACGRASLALGAIEGREGDVLWLEGPGAPVPVFADMLTRVIVAAFPEVEDYEVVEQDRGRWHIGLNPLPRADRRRGFIDQCLALTSRLNAYPPTISVAALVARSAGHKQRRVRGGAASGCAS